MFTLQGKKEKEPRLCFNPSTELTIRDKGRELAANVTLSAMITLTHAQNANKQKQKQGFLLWLQ